MEWWLWIVCGFGLLIAELFVTSGFFLFVFGLSALLLGLLLLGLSFGTVVISETNQYIAYAILTVIMLLTVRRQMASKLFAGSKDVADEFSGKEVLITSEIEPNGSGSAELRGTVWKVVNTGSAALRVGERAIISRVEGLTLFVQVKQ